jgi:hypothetical protein
MIFSTSLLRAANLSQFRALTSPEVKYNRKAVSKFTSSSGENRFVTPVHKSTQLSTGNWDTRSSLNVSRNLFENSSSPLLPHSLSEPDGTGKGLIYLVQ